MRKIKKGDNVVVIAGRDKGKHGDDTRIPDKHVSSPTSTRSRDTNGPIR